MKTLIKECILTLIIISLIVLLVLLLFRPSVEVVKADSETPPTEGVIASSSLLAKPVDDMDEIISKLAHCESRGNPKALNPHDPVTPSYGLLQFKADTFYHYNQIYKVLPDLERGEVLNVIYDPSIQITLAKSIIRDGGYKNWYNCLKPLFE